MNTKIGAVADVLNRWSAGDNFGGFSKTLVFGSIVHRDGDQFNPQTGDIDLAYIFTADGTAVERWNILRELYNQGSNLELLLLRALERHSAAAAIASHCVLTPLEASVGVHKDGHPRLLTGARFVELPWASNLPTERVPITDAVDDEFLQTNQEPADVFAFVQKTRNEFLSVAPCGVRTMQPLAVDNDPVSKPLMRLAATLAWFAEQSEIENREDLARGLEYLCDEVLKPATDAPEVRVLKERVGVRRRSRGTPHPLTPEDQMLLAELLFDHAKALAKPSLTQRLMDHGTRMIHMTQRSSDQES
jgi:hypothetical protein